MATAIKTTSMFGSPIKTLLTDMSLLSILASAFENESFEVFHGIVAFDGNICCEVLSDYTLIKYEKNEAGNTVVFKLGVVKKDMIGIHFSNQANEFEIHRMINDYVSHGVSILMETEVPLSASFKAFLEDCYKDAVIML